MTVFSNRSFIATAAVTYSGACHGLAFKFAMKAATPKGAAKKTPTPALTQDAYVRAQRLRLHDMVVFNLRKMKKTVAISKTAASSKKHSESADRMQWLQRSQQDQRRLQLMYKTVKIPYGDHGPQYLAVAVQQKIRKMSNEEVENLIKLVQREFRYEFDSNRSEFHHKKFSPEISAALRELHFSNLRRMVKLEGGPAFVKRNVVEELTKLNIETPTGQHPKVALLTLESESKYRWSDEDLAGKIGELVNINGVQKDFWITQMIDKDLLGELIKMRATMLGHAAAAGDPTELQAKITEYTTTLTKIAEDAKNQINRLSAEVRRRFVDALWKGLEIPELFPSKVSAALRKLFFTTLDDVVNRSGNFKKKVAAAVYAKQQLGAMGIDVKQVTDYVEILKKFENVSATSLSDKYLKKYISNFANDIDQQKWIEKLREFGLTNELIHMRAQMAQRDAILTDVSGNTTKEYTRDEIDISMDKAYFREENTFIKSRNRQLANFELWKGLDIFE